MRACDAAAILGRSGFGTIMVAQRRSGAHAWPIVASTVSVLAAL